MLLLLVLLFAPLLGAGVEASEAKADGYETPPPGRISTTNKRRLTPQVNRIAKQYCVDPALVHAVISAESGYDPQAVSPTGAIGLMQLLPTTAQDYGVENAEDLFDPVTNITAGTRHLNRLMRKYRNINHALAAYNAGEGTVERYRRSVTYLETRKYVAQVLNYYGRYQGGRIKVTFPVKRSRKLRSHR